ncbi:MAG: hypothetical protein M0Z82_07130 [Actinomycetota bacterium]|nr:hypothetical protein [Actinomycetota bacterium]
MSRLDVPSPPAPRRRSEEGLTLVEVLVAATIGLGVLLMVSLVVANMTSTAQGALARGKTTGKAFVAAEEVQQVLAGAWSPFPGTSKSVAIGGTEVTLYAAPGATSITGCTQGAPCSLRGAIAVATSAGANDTTTVVLEHSNGSPCSTTSECTFDGTSTVDYPPGATGSLIVQGASPAATVLDAAGATGSTFAVQSGTVALQSVTVTGGSSALGGGGVLNSGKGTVQITDSTVTANTASLIGGGGVLNSDSGTVHIVDSTVSGNTSLVGGGGILNATILGGSATTTVVDSTVSGNTANLVGGGGILNSNTVLGAATTTVVDSTVSGNTSLVGGGGIFNSNTILGGATTTLAGTIVATQASGGNCAGSIADAGYNLSSGTSCAFGTAHPAPPGSEDSVSTLDLGPLADNGGPTQTMALGSASAASAAITSPATVTVGTSSVELCSGSYSGASLAADQRGVARPSVGCSAGAYQVSSSSTPAVISECAGGKAGQPFLPGNGPFVPTATPASHIELCSLLRGSTTAYTYSLRLTGCDGQGLCTLQVDRLGALGCSPPTGTTTCTETRMLTVAGVSEGDPGAASCTTRSSGSPLFSLCDTSGGVLATTTSWGQVRAVAVELNVPVSVHNGVAVSGTAIWRAVLLPNTLAGGS